MTHICSNTDFTLLDQFTVAASKIFLEHVSELGEEFFIYLFFLQHVSSNIARMHASAYFIFGIFIGIYFLP